MNRRIPQSDWIWCALIIQFNKYLGCFYRTVDTSNQTIETMEGISSNDSNILVENLNPFTSYVFQVVANFVQNYTRTGNESDVIQTASGSKYQRWTLMVESSLSRTKCCCHGDLSSTKHLSSYTMMEGIFFSD